MRAIAALFAALTVVGCTPKPWVSHPMPRPPDRACRTGGGAGHDVWIWECIDNQRVVVSQYCGGFVGCQRAEREVVACGEQTPLERQLADYLGPSCQQPPSGRHWPAQ